MTTVRETAQRTRAATRARGRSAPPAAPTLTCKGWPQEAAMRMLMNNLDPEVAEHPDQLIVYGGSGRAARSWDAFDAIVGVAAATWRATRRCWSSRASRSACSAPTSGRPGC